MVMSMAYAKTAQMYKGIDWDSARCFADLSIEHWRKIQWEVK